jgi:hypothetical protein
MESDKEQDLFRPEHWEGEPMKSLRLVATATWVYVIIGDDGAALTRPETVRVIGFPLGSPAGFHLRSGSGDQGLLTGSGTL